METKTEKDKIAQGLDDVLSKLKDLPQLDGMKIESDKLLKRFAPEEQGEAEFEGRKAFVTLTKMGSVIITFSFQEDARKYFKSIKK